MALYFHNLHARATELHRRRDEIFGDSGDGGEKQGTHGGAEPRIFSETEGLVLYAGLNEDLTGSLLTYARRRDTGPDPCNGALFRTEHEVALSSTTRGCLTFSYRAFFFGKAGPVLDLLYCNDFGIAGGFLGFGYSCGSVLALLSNVAS